MFDSKKEYVQMARIGSGLARLQKLNWVSERVESNIGVKLNELYFVLEIDSRRNITKLELDINEPALE